MKFDDAAWNKWSGWTDAIRADVSQTMGDKATFCAFRAVVADNEAWIMKNHGYRFCGFVLRAYATRTALAIRRQVKNDSQSASLARLLTQLQSCARQITNEYYEQVSA